MLRKLRVVDFSWREHGKSKADQVGVLAHEVEAVLPNLVSETHVNDALPDQKLVNTLGMVPMLISAVQELSDRVEMLEARLAG